MLLPFSEKSTKASERFGAPVISAPFRFVPCKKALEKLERAPSPDEMLAPFKFAPVKTASSKLAAARWDLSAMAPFPGFSRRY